MQRKTQRQRSADQARSFKRLFEENIQLKKLKTQIREAANSGDLEEVKRLVGQDAA